MEYAYHLAHVGESEDTAADALQLELRARVDTSGVRGAGGALAGRRAVADDLVATDIEESQGVAAGLAHGNGMLAHLLHVVVIGGGEPAARKRDTCVARALQIAIQGGLRTDTAMVAIGAAGAEALGDAVANNPVPAGRIYACRRYGLHQRQATGKEAHPRGCR